MAKPVPSISVCICTHKRPLLLKRLLADLDHQQTEGLFTYSIVVVENDTSQSAEGVVSEFAAASAIPVKYCVQPLRNIALTRNRAVENATGDFIAFIDDDEFPIERWLLNMFNTLNDFGVDGVLGPVLPHFDEGAPRWIINGGLFDRPRHPTGLALGWTQTRTGNVLMKNEMFAREGHRFNQEFLSGSDQEFFKRMINNGRKFVWADEAVVYEVVPPARWKRGFLIRRAIFRGVFSLRNRRRMMPKAILWSLFAAPAYVLALPVAFLLGQGKFMSYVFSLAYHVGRLLASVGINPIKEQYVSD